MREQNKSVDACSVVVGAYLVLMSESAGYVTIHGSLVEQLAVSVGISFYILVAVPNQSLRAQRKPSECQHRNV